jgi:hypothetical protein
MISLGFKGKWSIWQRQGFHSNSDGIIYPLPLLMKLSIGIHLHSYFFYQMGENSKGSQFVIEPPKSLGPPTVVLVPWTSDNPAGAPDHLTSSVSEFLTFPRAFYRHADITNHRRCGSAEAVTITYFY